jgi:hypothetical protein
MAASSKPAPIETVVLPAEGVEVTVLVERDGAPLSQRARVGKVSEASLLLQRAPGVPAHLTPFGTGPRTPLHAYDRVTVMFEVAGRLHLWPMLVEEVLPSSCYLVAERAPTLGERRQFVRARVHANLGIGRLGGAQPIVRPSSFDLSASGLSAVVPDAWEHGTHVAIAIVESPDMLPIVATSEVVRCAAAKGGYQLAVLFDELTSQDEKRLAHLVHTAREQALVERLGRRRAL